MDNVIRNILEFQERGLGNLERANRALQDVSSTNRWTAFTSSVTAANAALSLFTPVIGAAQNAVEKMVQSGLRVEATRLTWKGLLGDMNAAQRRMEEINAFASNAPFTKIGIEEAAIQMQALNKYSKEALTAMGNLAAAFPGRTIQQATEAALGATRMEFDPLEKFGINKTLIAQEIGIAAADVHAETAKEVERIWDATVAIIQRKHGTMMAELMNSTQGQITNLQDAMGRAWEQMGVATTSPVKTGVGIALDQMNTMLNDGTFKRIGEDIGGLLSESLKLVSAMAQAGNTGGKIGGLAGVTSALWGGQLDLKLLAGNQNINRAIQLGIDVGGITEADMFGVGSKLLPGGKLNAPIPTRAPSYSVRIPPQLQGPLLEAAAMLGTGKDEESVRAWLASQLALAFAPASMRSGPRYGPEIAPGGAAASSGSAIGGVAIPAANYWGPLGPGDYGPLGYGPETNPFVPKQRGTYGPENNPALRGYEMMVDAATDAYANVDRIRKQDVAEAKRDMEQYLAGVRIMNAGVQAMAGSTSRVVSGFLLKEHIDRMKGVDIAKYVASQTAGAVISGIAQEATAQAGKQVALALGAFPNAAAMAAHFASAAKWGLLGGLAGGVGAAITQGSQESFDRSQAATYGSGSGSAAAGSATSRAATSNGVRALNAAAAPTTVNYNLMVTYQGAVVYGEGGTKDWLRRVLIPMLREEIEMGALAG